MAARCLLAALLLSVSLSGSAAALAPPTGWDGKNPFDCEVQKAGFGATVKHPEADPYCVDFDKTHQNVTQLGVADFLSKEPARVAAAVPKCFYFQSDHWRGSVVQDDGSTKTYEWDGHYFFDKARGEGGAWVTNFNVNGHTGDPSAFPGIPAEWAQFLGPGTGGVITRDDIPADPGCAARARKGHVYAAAPGAGHTCAGHGGGLTARRVGPVELGDRERALRARLGAPGAVRRGFLRWCVSTGGILAVGVPGDRSGDLGEADGPAYMLLTTARVFRWRGIAPGAGASRLRGRPAVAHLGQTRVVQLAPSVLAGTRGGRVRFLVVYDRRRLRTARALRGALARAGAYTA